jgi:ERCC4-type nuclease
VGQLTLTADTREVRSGVPDFLTAFLAAGFIDWKNTTVSLEIKQLKWGDYKWTALGDSYAIERKAVKDLLDSMNQKEQVAAERVHKVTRQLHECILNANHVYLIIEGDQWIENGRLLCRRTIQSLESMLMRYETKGVTVWLTDDPFDTARRIAKLFELTQRDSKVWPW